MKVVMRWVTREGLLALQSELRGRYHRALDAGVRACILTELTAIEAGLATDATRFQVRSEQG